MNKSYLLSLFYFFIFIITSNGLSSKESSFSYGDYFYEQLKKYGETQDDMDLLFSEYCYINFYVDPICHDEVDEPDKEDSESVELNNNDTISQTFYTTANVNLRQKPNINSPVLILIYKHEPIDVFQVSDQDNDWLLANYKNQQGYVNVNYVSKDKPTKVKIVQNDTSNEEKINTITDSLDSDWSEFINKETNRCIESYDPITSYNLKKSNDDYCACYPEKIKEITTSEDMDYYEQNEEFSDDFISRMDEVKVDCAKKAEYYFDVTDELREVIKDDIQKCETTFDSELPFSRDQHNKWCKCFYNKWDSLVTKDDTDYFKKHDKPSDSFIKKEDELGTFCFSQLS